MILIADNHHGIYGPQVAAKHILGIYTGDNERVKRLCEEVAQGPDFEFYHEAWDDLTNEEFVWCGELNTIIENDGDIWLATEQQAEAFYSEDDDEPS